MSVLFPSHEGPNNRSMQPLLSLQSKSKRSLEILAAFGTSPLSSSPLLYQSTDFVHIGLLHHSVEGIQDVKVTQRLEQINIVIALLALFQGFQYSLTFGILALRS